MVFSVFDMELSDPIVEMHLQNTLNSKEDWARAFQIEETNPESINITIQLYKKQKDIFPTKEDLRSVVKTIEEADGLPYGAYNILLHDHYVDRYMKNIQLKKWVLIILLKIHIKER